MHFFAKTCKNKNDPREKKSLKNQFKITVDFYIFKMP